MPEKSTLASLPFDQQPKTTQLRQPKNHAAAPTASNVHTVACLKLNAATY
jgi:hypothetical protein